MHEHVRTRRPSGVCLGVRIVAPIVLLFALAACGEKPAPQIAAIAPAAPTAVESHAWPDEWVGEWVNDGGVRWLYSPVGKQMRMQFRRGNTSGSEWGELHAHGRMLIVRDGERRLLRVLKQSGANFWSRTIANGEGIREEVGVLDAAGTDVVAADASGLAVTANLSRLPH